MTLTFIRRDLQTLLEEAGNCKTLYARTSDERAEAVRKFRDARISTRWRTETRWYHRDLYGPLAWDVQLLITRIANALAFTRDDLALFWLDPDAPEWDSEWDRLIARMARIESLIVEAEEIEERSVAMRMKALHERGIALDFQA